jgi:hypothetical protein
MENNFYLDDVNIRSQILPARLKNDGYLILPNPFRNTFGVWHYQVPTNLRYVNVYNTVGQLVYSKNSQVVEKILPDRSRWQSSGNYIQSILDMMIVTGM